MLISAENCNAVKFIAGYLVIYDESSHSNCNKNKKSQIGDKLLHLLLNSTSYSLITAIQ